MNSFKNLKYSWKSLWQPELYHGWKKNKNFFEGWYFKLVDQAQKTALAFIPGISMDGNGDKHAFIQILDGMNAKSAYHRFDIKDFQADKQNFEVRIGPNIFTISFLDLNLPGYKGRIKFSAIVPWPKYLAAPGIMGWYSFVPFMECYHGILSMDHELSGNLIIKDQIVDFIGGRGYIEKDWGVSFPKSWIWMQSNHFGGTLPISLTASVAHIPWLGNFFIGFIVGFYYKSKIYRFASYTGAKMKASVDKDHVKLSFKSRRYRIEIRSEKASGGQLISPIKGEMKGKLNESLQAKTELSFFENGNLVFKGKSAIGGLEIAGEYEMLLTDYWRN